MKIIVKTEMITLQIEDELIVGSDGYVKHQIPQIQDVLEQIIEQAIKLHSEVIRIK